MTVKEELRKLREHKLCLDYNKWYQEDFSQSGNCLVLCFTASTETFEWYRTFNETLKDLKMKKIYIMDAGDVWWHGVYITPTKKYYGPIQLSDFLRERILESGCDKIITIGASRAGYGAILFGCLLNTDLALSFSPQTNVTKYLNKRFNIYNKMNVIENMFPEYTIDKSLIDLKYVLESYGKDNKTIYNIFYGKLNQIDCDHVDNISNFPNIVLHTLDRTSHKLAKSFLNIEIPQKIIRTFLEN